MRAECAKCGMITEISDNARKYVCRQCGALNIPQPRSGDQVCKCVLSNPRNWVLPIGHDDTFLGRLYVSVLNEMLTRDEWLTKYGFDPEIAAKWKGKR